MHGGVIFVTALALVTLGDPAPPTTASDFSIGIGYAVSQQARGNDEPLLQHAQRSEDEQEPEPPSANEESSAETAERSLIPRLPPPPSDLARVQGSPRARGLHAAAAIAAQMAMLVAGAVAVRDQRRRARAAQRGRAPPYKPYR